MDFLEPQENLVLLAKRGPLVSLVNLAHQVKLVTLGHQVPKENQGKKDPWGLLETRAREVSAGPPGEQGPRGDRGEPGQEGEVKLSYIAPPPAFGTWDFVISPS